MRITIRTRWVAAACFGLSLAFAACGGGGKDPIGPSPPPPPPAPAQPTVTSITVTGTLSLSAVGQVTQLTATAVMSNGTSQNVTSQATWQSSSSAVATVSSAGVVTAVASGTATITASYQSKSGTLVVTVTIPQIPNINGTWRGAYFICCGAAVSNDGRMTLQLTQTQDGASFTGSMTITGDVILGPTTGTIQGTWLPNFNYFTYTVTVPRGGMRDWPECTATLNQSNLSYHSSGAPGTGGAYLDGGFFGNWCGVPIASGTLQLPKL
jgi:hypothetical protein